MSSDLSITEGFRPDTAPEVLSPAMPSPAPAQAEEGTLAQGSGCPGPDGTETACPEGGQIRMELVSLPSVNFALQQNGIPTVRAVRIDNGTSRDIRDAELRISAAPPFFRPFRKTVSFIPAKSSLELKDPDLQIDAEYLAGLTEKAAGVLSAELVQDGRTLCAENAEISVQAFNEWPGYGVFPELLAAFVTPNHPAVGGLVSRAADFLGEWTGDPSLDGYQSRDTNRALLQAAAVFKALQEQNIVYAEPPASFATAGQRVRLCDEVLSLKLGTCLDLTLLYAACLEAIGLHPLLVLQKGHIFAGLWLENSTFPESVQDDVSLLTKRLAEGTRLLAVVECTMFTAGKNAAFDDACRSAEHSLLSRDEVECFIDVRRARLSRISPLPARVLTPEGWKVQRRELDADVLTAAPEHVSAPIDLPGDSRQEFSKKVLWERKLLDLGLRNTLLNLRLTRTMVPILSSSLDDLEDALAAGGDFSVRPRPADWQAEGGRIGLESLHIVEGYSDLLQSEFRAGRLRSALSEAELANALKNLYRAARSDMEENGANTLYMALGLLKWFETDRSTQPRYAPLLLLPVEMVRKSAAEGYIIRLRDDEAQMNVTLLEKLRQDYSVEIGGLDPLPADDRGVDTRRVFAAVRHGIMEQKRWDVLESACLGIFSFSQFVMWNDIHNRAEDLSRSKVVRSLMENRLAWQAEDMHFEGQVPEDGVLLPIPADASQLYAIESAGEGKSFVLHGPPGTGKSQTITALIANALARGKTVLFVAEKMAALEVVQKRLAKIGLAPFCLELHSNKAKKRDVLEQLRQASEVTKYRSSGEYAVSAERIAALRGELNRYVTALHKRQNCGMTVFALINAYQAYRDAPEAEGFSDAFFSGIDETRLYELDTLTDSLVSAGRGVGHPQGHPLAEVRCRDYSQQLKRSAADSAGEYRRALAALGERARSFADAVGRAMPASLSDYRRLAEEARYLCALEPYPSAWVQAEDAESLLDRAVSLAEHRLSAEAYRQRLSERWSEGLLAMDGAALLEEYRQQSAKWFLGRLFGMKRFRQQLASCAKGDIRDDALGQDLTVLAAYQAEKKAADELYPGLAEGLGALDRGGDTDWKQVEETARSAKSAVNRQSLIPDGKALRVSFGADKRALEAACGLREAWSGVEGARESLYALLELAPEAEEHWLPSQEALCGRIMDHADALREWVLWNKAAREAEDAGLGPIVKAYREGLAHDAVKPACRKAIYKGLSVLAIEADQTLNLFSGKDFNGKIEQFGKIDQELTELAKSEIYCCLAAQVPNFTTASVGSSETGILQRAIRSGGRGTSIRRLFEQIPNLLPKLCPCMLMSPISVAQYLDPNRAPFDLVVFDEASQLPTSKAIGALARGENAIVVGDPKQMPPTSFFASSSTDEEHLEEEDMESILDDCLALNMPQTHLLWHYRSRHESLIAFSNSQFYENKLYTFPSVNDRESRVRLIHVEGVFDRGGRRINREEAAAVVEELKRRCHDPACAELSVGVVTFNISQQNLIEDMLTDACREDPLLEDWAYHSPEPIFIKNLENVQGDERDVILFSVAYGPDKAGKVTMNFGPLNRDGGWRRLNVAVSRARYEMVVFATLTPDQISLTRTCAEGVVALKRFLEFASGAQLAEAEGAAPAGREAAGGIADAICLALREQGYETDQAVGESAYKIDIGVVDPHNPEKYLLGILLDGAGYRSAQTTRDREIAQIGVLRGLGWRILRVWSMDWWDNSRRELDRILEALRAAEEEEAPEPETGAAEAPSVEAPETPPPPPPQEEEPMLKGMIRSGPQERQAIPLYTGSRLPVTPMTPEAFADPVQGSRRLIAERIRTVLEQEGPISESLLTRRVVQSFAISRAGSRIQMYLAELYRSMKLRTTLQGGERFYWREDQDPRAYAGFRANGEGDGKREPRDIPVQEAANAVCLALEEQFSLPEGDLIRAAANLMGFSRMGTAVNALFLGAVTWAWEAGRIRKTDSGSWVLEDPPSPD